MYAANYLLCLLFQLQAYQSRSADYFVLCASAGLGQQSVLEALCSLLEQQAAPLRRREMHREMAWQVTGVVGLSEGELSPVCCISSFSMTKGSTCNMCTVTEGGFGASSSLTAALA